MISRRHFHVVRGLLAFTLFASLLGQLHAADKKPLNVAGAWTGTLEVMGAKLRLVFNIQKKDGGGYSATMDSPDQGVKGVAVDEVTLEGRTLKLNIKAIQGGFEGELSTKAKEIPGNWSQGGLKLPITLKPSETAK